MANKLKILHLEDLRADAMLVEKALRKNNLDYEKLVVDTRAGFIKALGEFVPDVILSDHSLPSFNSHDALNILQAAGLKIPFILITANISEEFAVDVIKRGADDYILKDRLQRLPSAITNSCEKFRLDKERQHFLDEIIRNEKRYRALIENIHDAIILVDIHSLVIYQSPSAKYITGFTFEESEGKNVFDNVHPEDKSACADLFLQATEQPGIFRSDQFRILHKNGHYIWTEGSITNLLHDESVKALIVTYRDITKRKHAEAESKSTWMQLIELNDSLEKNAKELAMSNAELEQFAYVASHDLQEPLRMVTSFLAQIDKKYSTLLDDKGKQYIHFAVDGAKRMRQIILDLLEFSRIDRFQNEPEKVEVAELVREILLLHSSQIEDSNAMITFSDLPDLHTHKTPLRQVFQNLISNALKYRQEQNAPVISISCTEQTDSWLFCIKDNGIGIDADYFEKIFVIFQRLHSREEYSGTGIGLAICKKIVENMGGRIWVESAENKGSTFLFTVLKK